ncbi:MAG: response regulator, partial [Pseudomonadota bacterium]|nr:response regulator [Pseudomonadota bacterium]
GANTTLINSGAEAPNVSHQHFDVLIADYHLNYGENGFDVAAILSEENVSFALKILVTANRSNEIREKAAASQFSYLPKPLKPAALKRLLKQSLPHHH